MFPPPSPQQTLTQCWGIVWFERIAPHSLLHPPQEISPPYPLPPPMILRDNFTTSHLCIITVVYDHCVEWCIVTVILKFSLYGCEKFCCCYSLQSSTHPVPHCLCSKVKKGVKQPQVEGGGLLKSGCLWSQRSDPLKILDVHPSLENATIA